MSISVSVFGQSNDWMGFATGLTGAIIGGAATLLAVRLQQRHQVSLQRTAQSDAVRGYLQAIQTEIVLLWDAYMREVGYRVEALGEGEALKATWVAETDYFVVYRTGSGLLGHVPNPELRAAIVGTYITAMGLLESFKVHKLMTLEAAEKQAAAHGSTFGMWDGAKAYAEGLRGQHGRFKQSVADLQLLLAAELR